MRCLGFPMTQVGVTLVAGCVQATPQRDPSPPSLRADPIASSDDAPRETPAAAQPAEAGIGPRTAADEAPWMDLAPIFSERFGREGWVLDPEVGNDAEMRALMCVDSAWEPAPCTGTGPWLLRFDPNGQDSGSWAHVLALHHADGWVVSEAFGLGGLARCAAHTEATLAQAGSHVVVTISDHLEFPEYLCEDGEDVPEEDCEQWMGSCGTPISTECTMTFDPATLETEGIEGQCSAYDAGTAQGLEF